MEGGWVGQVRQWHMATKQLNLREHLTQRPPEHLNPYSQPCVRKTFSASFIPAQPVENDTFKILHLLHQYITGETYFKSIKPYSMIGHLLINYEM